MSLASSPPLTATIAARIERLPMTRWQITVRVVIGVVTFFDAFDQLLISYVLPVISQEWRMSTAGSTWAITAGSLGMLLGALLSGWLADRFGRVRVIIVTLLVYSLSSLLLALSPSFGFFLALRFIQGFGIGGEVPVAATYIGEIAKAHRRGRFVLLYELIFPVGLAAAALVATWVVPTFGWRWLFAIGALPLPAALIIHKLVPESPRWLAAKGYDDRALSTMEYIEKKVRKVARGPLPEPVVRPELLAQQSGRTSWRGLFAGRYRRRTLTLWTLWFTAYFVLYGIVSWLPSIYSGHFHLAVSDALKYSMVGTLAGVVGSVLIALTIDKLGRKRAIGGALVSGGLLLLVLWLLGASTALQLVVWCSLAAIFINAANLALYLYTPELYPTRTRGLGSSIAGVWNRLGVIIGPVVIGAVVASGSGFATVFLMLGCVALAGGVAAFLFAEETSGRTLEELSP